MVYLFLLFNLFFMVSGQILWKLALDRAGGLHFHNLLHVLLSPMIIGGVALYGLATVAWLVVLSRLPLSVAYPLQSLAYVFGMVTAYYLFQETIPFHRWIGVGLIVFGVYIISLK